MWIGVPTIRRGTNRTTRPPGSTELSTFAKDKLPFSESLRHLAECVNRLQSSRAESNHSSRMCPEYKEQANRLRISRLVERGVRVWGPERVYIGDEVRLDSMRRWTPDRVA